MKYCILLLVSACTSFIAWNYCGIIFLASIYILFYIANALENSSLFKKTTILYGFFIVLNISSTFWLLDVNKFDAIVTWLANSILFLLFSFPLLVAKIKHRQLVFILVWVFGEIILSQWDLACPWLNFGNVMGNQYQLIQWYSYLGVYGGSLWLLITTYFIFQISIKTNTKQSFAGLVLLLSLPIFSLFDFYYSPATVVVDNYKKTTCYIPEIQESNYTKTKEIYNYVLKHNINHTIIATEIFYSNVYPDYLTDSDFSFLYKQLFIKHQNLNFILGAEISNNKADKFNVISCFGNNFSLFKTKKRYIPGTEFVTPVLRPLYGESFYKKNNSDNSSEIAKRYNTVPFVCYESIFSDFVASFNHQILIVLASESFLADNDFGKAQYLNIQRIRAIENNKYLLKCSYNGFSGLINPKGEIESKFNTGFSTLYTPMIKGRSVYQKIINLFVN